MTPAIQGPWSRMSRSLPSGAHSRDPLADTGRACSSGVARQQGEKQLYKYCD
jgi:hypothetical protein